MKKSKLILPLLLAAVCVLVLFTACDGSDKPELTSGTSAEANAGSLETSGAVIPSTSVGTTAAPEFPEGAKLIALTYDDGPYQKTTSRILEILKKNNSVATFFIVGNRIDGTVSTIQQAIDLGCEIGNHTYDHKNLTKVDADARAHQINDTNNKMKEHFGYEVTLLRAPEGAIKGIKDEVGMPLIQWSVDTEDWKHKDASNPGRSEAQRQAEINEIVNEVVENAEEGDVILMHDIYDFTADMSEVLIPKLIEKGFTLVTVSQLYDHYGINLEAGNSYQKARVEEPETTLAPGRYTVRIDTDSSLNLRDKPGADSVILAEIPNGTAVIVTEFSGNWAKVSYNSFDGWINTAYLQPDSAA